MQSLLCGLLFTLNLEERDAQAKSHDLKIKKDELWFFFHGHEVRRVSSTRRIGFLKAEKYE